MIYNRKSELYQLFMFKSLHPSRGPIVPRHARRAPKTRPSPNNSEVKKEHELYVAAMEAKEREIYAMPDEPEIIPTAAQQEILNILTFREGNRFQKWLAFKFRNGTLREAYENSEGAAMATWMTQQAVWNDIHNLWSIRENE